MILEMKKLGGENQELCLLMRINVKDKFLFISNRVPRWILHKNFVVKLFSVFIYQIILSVP